MKTERTLYREGKYLVLDGTGEERRNKEAILQEGIYVVRECEGSERSKRAKRRKLTLIFFSLHYPFPCRIEIKWPECKALWWELSLKSMARKMCTDGAGGETFSSPNSYNQLLVWSVNLYPLSTFRQYLHQKGEAQYTWGFSPLPHSSTSATNWPPDSPAGKSTSGNCFISFRNLEV